MEEKPLSAADVAAVTDRREREALALAFGATASFLRTAE